MILVREQKVHVKGLKFQEVSTFFFQPEPIMVIPQH